MPDRISPARSGSSTTSWAEGSAGRARAVPDDTLGSSRPWICRADGSDGPNTQRPSGVMPTGRTSNRAGSRLASTLAADTQDTACSELRPPNTTATRSLGLAMGTDPTQQFDEHRQGL